MQLPRLTSSTGITIKFTRPAVLKELFLMSYAWLLLFKLTLTVTAGPAKTKGLSQIRSLTQYQVPAGSPSCGWDAAVYVSDINQPS